ncbi:hypothetical protein VTK56DRAFT_5621 [Thermocarpiscus australiensis]
MAENGKRKDAPTSGTAQQRAKKKKTGNAGKWKTPHQQAKAAMQQEGSLQPGDTGIWVSCARRQEAKAAGEIGVLFAEYAEKMYGIKSVHDAEDDDGDADDIEAAIQKEVAALKASGRTSGGGGGGVEDGHSLTPIKMNVDCLLFVKTQPPIEPVAFVRRICEDAKKARADPGQMRCRYVNRLTPVSVTGKATEQGIVEVARAVLAPFFDLSGKRSGGGVPGASAASAESAADGDGQKDAGEKAEGGNGGEASTPVAARPEGKPFTFAIRPTIRNNSNLKRDVVINSIAGLINDDRHKVNLTSPDKVILVDVYQNVCGMSVVDGDWDELKRFNLTELYSQARTAAQSSASSHD